MKKLSFPLLAILGTSLIISVTAQKSPPKDPCANPQTQAEMNICAGKDYKAADAALNRVYNQLTSKLEGAERAKLKDAESAWLKYRDADCDYEASFFEGGTIQPMILSSCFARVTKARTAELREQIKDRDL